MSSDFLDISSALDGHMNGITSYPIAWENTVYTPIIGGNYFRPSILPASTEQAGLGSAGLDEHIGIYQVDVYTEAGKGRRGAEFNADAVADHFKRGTSLTYNGVVVRLGDTSRSAGIIDGDRFVISVSINYSAHVAPR
tara:strand:+ start:5322 stop:5735 length:414 start_codon:yes stop_codon:yes gene_type:complete